MAYRELVCAKGCEDKYSTLIPERNDPKYVQRIVRNTEAEERMWGHVFDPDSFPMITFDIK